MRAVEVVVMHMAGVVVEVGAEVATVTVAEAVAAAGAVAVAAAEAVAVVGAVAAAEAVAEVGIVECKLVAVVAVAVAVAVVAVTEHMWVASVTSREQPLCFSPAQLQISSHYGRRVTI